MTESTVACFPWFDHPYLTLLYDHLRQQGFVREEGAEFNSRWLWSTRARAPVLHFHWPDNLYRHLGGPQFARPALSWLKFAAFLQRLCLARVLGYRLVWTVHQVYPHERTTPGRDNVAARILAALCHRLIVHDSYTGAQVIESLGNVGRKVEVIPIGSLAPFYSEGTPPGKVRRELLIDPDAF